MIRRKRNYYFQLRFSHYEEKSVFVLCNLKIEQNTTGFEIRAYAVILKFYYS